MKFSGFSPCPTLVGTTAKGKVEVDAISILKQR